MSDGPRVAVFSFSRNGALICFIFLSLIIGYGLIDDTNEVIHGTIVGGPSALFPVAAYESVVLLSLAFILSRRERTVDLYPDSLKITGWKTNVKVPYSEVTDVSVREMKLFGKTLPYRGIFITIRGQGDPFFISGNPKIRKLKTDLYPWLVAKAGPQHIVDGSVSS
jgi:hypothetical protein